MRNSGLGNFCSRIQEILEYFGWHHCFLHTGLRGRCPMLRTGSHHVVFLAGLWYDEAERPWRGQHWPQGRGLTTWIKSRSSTSEGKAIVWCFKLVLKVMGVKSANNMLLIFPVSLFNMHTKLPSYSVIVSIKNMGIVYKGMVCFRVKLPPVREFSLSLCGTLNRFNKPHTCNL